MSSWLVMLSRVSFTGVSYAWTPFVIYVVLDCISPDEVAWSQQVQPVVGEVFAEFAVLVNEERVEVDPSYALALTHLFHSPVAVDYHLLAVFEEFPHLHVGVERQHRLQVYFGTRRTILDEDDEFFHRPSDAVAINAVRHVVDAAEDENLAWLALENRLHALI